MDPQRPKIVNYVTLNLNISQFDKTTHGILDHFKKLEDLQILLLWDELWRRQVLQIKFVGQARQKLELQLRKPYIQTLAYDNLKNYIIVIW